MDNKVTFYKDGDDSAAEVVFGEFGGNGQKKELLGNTDGTGDEQCDNSHSDILNTQGNTQKDLQKNISDNGVDDKDTRNEVHDTTSNSTSNDDSERSDQDIKADSCKNNNTGDDVSHTNVEASSTTDTKSSEEIQNASLRDEDTNTPKSSTQASQNEVPDSSAAKGNVVKPTGDTDKNIDASADDGGECSKATDNEKSTKTKANKNVCKIFSI